MITTTIINIFVFTVATCVAPLCKTIDISHFHSFQSALRDKSIILHSNRKPDIVARNEQDKTGSQKTFNLSSEQGIEIISIRTAGSPPPHLVLSILVGRGYL